MSFIESVTPITKDLLRFGLVMHCDTRNLIMRVKKSS